MNLRFLGVGALILLTSCGGGATKQDEIAKEVETLVAVKTETTLKNTYPATVQGQEDVSIRPRTDGFIEHIYVDEGSNVKAGAPLFRINSPSSDEALRTTQAALLSAEANVKTAELNVEKLKPLVADGIISDYQLKTAENASTESKARLAQARAALTNAQVSRSWATVTSPVNGVVGRINFRKGSLVDRAMELTTVSNTSNVYAYFSLSEKELLEFLSKIPGNTQAEKIKNSPEVELLLLDRTTYDKRGKIETISGVVNTKTGSINCRAKFSNSEGILRSGSSGNIVIPNVVSDIFIVPQKATFAQQDKILLYRVIEGVATQASVDVVATPGGLSYVVYGGLAEGDVIIADGINSINNGDKVTVQ